MWFIISHESVSWPPGSALFTQTHSRGCIQPVGQQKEKAQDGSPHTSGGRCQLLAGCLSSSPYSLWLSSKRDWLLTWKFQGSIQEGNGKAAGPVKAWALNAICCHFHQSKSQKQCKFKEWKIQSIPDPVVINFIVLLVLLVIPFFNQVSSFSLRSFHSAPVT